MFLPIFHLEYGILQTEKSNRHQDVEKDPSGPPGQPRDRTRTPFTKNEGREASPVAKRWLATEKSMHRRAWLGFQNVEEAGEFEGIDRASGRIAAHKSLNRSGSQGSTTCAQLSSPGP